MIHATKKNSLKIAILGTRGIPNRYGGFEQFAEHCSVSLSEIGYEVSVYCSHFHPYKNDDWKGVKLIHCFDPEHKIGTIGQFIYDFNCILDSRKRKFDVILQLGYTSSTVWSWLFPKRPLLITNMDGLERKRSKYNKYVQFFLKYAEKWGVKYSDYLIADSLAIQSYLLEKYQANSVFIPYGANSYLPSFENDLLLVKMNLKKKQYGILIARFEPENNIEIALMANSVSNNHVLILIGDYNATKFGQKMYHQYSSYPNIRFIGSMYDVDALNILRYNARLYIHGHSVGGTNPSLLEAMGCHCLIVAHDNIFNKSVLKENAFYFDDVSSLNKIINQEIDADNYEQWIQNNNIAIEQQYNWEIINQKLDGYLKLWSAQRK